MSLSPWSVNAETTFLIYFSQSMFLAQVHKYTSKVNQI